MGLFFPCFVDEKNEEKMIEWKERKYEEDEYDAQGENMTLVTLQECWLLKFFYFPLLGYLSLLLDQLVWYWEPDQD
jgi:hypothetical protein